MRLFRTAFSLVLLGASLSLSAQEAAKAAPKAAPDTVIFTNGDQLTGKLVRAAGGSIVFKSDMAGELTIPFSKIKQLRSGEQFAVLRNGAPVNKTVETGTIDVADGNVVVTPGARPPATYPTKEVAYLIDRTSFEQEISHSASFLHGWNGNINGGASIVRSTQNGTTLTAGLNLIRTIPTVSYLPSRNRTTVDVTESYGKLTSPATPTATASEVITSIFHADAERDEYFSKRAYGLAEVSFDHNYSQGLNLQQVYGLGAGWTPMSDARQQLDLKADVHFEKQEFQTASGNLDLFGSTFAEAYRRNLPRKLVFTENADYLPAWNNLHAYSANVTAALALPILKRLSASISTTDNYLNNPSEGFKHNSYQFVTGVTYTLH